MKLTTKENIELVKIDKLVKSNKATRKQLLRGIDLKHKQQYEPVVCRTCGELNCCILAHDNLRIAA